MGKLPTEIKLTYHARQRLEERKNPDNYYNTKNLMKSSCKWYTKDDLIQQSQLYLHCLYVCRKSNQMGYITDGKIEILYNKGTGVAITVLEVKEKFQPIIQYIKPEILEQIKRKKENKKNKNLNDTNETTITFHELYASLVTEILNDTSNLGYQSTENTKKNKQPYNIVYREKITNPMTISELFGVDKKVYEEAISAVKK